MYIYVSEAGYRVIAQPQPPTLKTFLFNGAIGRQPYINGYLAPSKFSTISLKKFIL